jgi:hypothetical protein
MGERPGAVLVYSGDIVLAIPGKNSTPPDYSNCRTGMDELSASSTWAAG